MLEHLMRHVKNDVFFTETIHTKLGFYDMKDLCSHFKLKKVRRGQNVFNNGETGDKFFIILKGLVSILVPYGVSKDELISRWKRFRDVTIDQYGEADLKEIRLYQEYDKKKQLRKKYNTLLKWKKEDFDPRLTEAIQRKIKEDTKKTFMYAQEGLQFKSTKFD